MADKIIYTPIPQIEDLIFLVRGQRVIFDSELARIYGVQLKRLNEQRRRNLDRFPKDFAFQLTGQELATLRSQIATSKGRGGRRYLPWVFTEHGAIMLASILNRDRAVQMSVSVVRAFVLMREQLAAFAQFGSDLDAKT
ncbi:MAG TPA: ORF6N domain-containing protein, partial [Verrucomicrobiae bacterium]